ncbi:hypothetical protein [Piscinibacter sakaiensis]|uniref:DUF998 domain-containing protein n=1 Tax=Piscinibacter sakaiensis TaxID=1547922 RepID=A0A0K8NV95_PISS1|nr:hypothetical protein [Piscinibacter sakaiensis]GAP34317.1 hypothetical protein ISF6_4492 [Piscinibacter sakaiensis]
MTPSTQRPEIDHRTLKLIVGVIALSFAGLTSWFAASRIESISASYYEGGWSQSFFIGFLFAVAAFLLAYNGQTRTELVLAKVAAVAALGVALYPCACAGHAARLPYVHGLSAAVLFLILAFFCLGFYRRARGKHRREADRRAVVYAVCGVLMLAAIAVLGLDVLLGGAWSRRIPRLVFVGEATALVAFGVSWLTASRTLPGLAANDERFRPLRSVNPD